MLVLHCNSGSYVVGVKIPRSLSPAALKGQIHPDEIGIIEERSQSGSHNALVAADCNVGGNKGFLQGAKQPALVAD